MAVCHSQDSYLVELNNVKEDRFVKYIFDLKFHRGEIDTNDKKVFLGKLRQFIIELEISLF